MASPRHTAAPSPSRMCPRTRLNCARPFANPRAAASADVNAPHAAHARTPHRAPASHTRDDDTTASPVCSLTPAQVISAGQLPPHAHPAFARPARTSSLVPHTRIPAAAATAARPPASTALPRTPQSHMRGGDFECAVRAITLDAAYSRLSPPLPHPRPPTSSTKSPPNLKKNRCRWSCPVLDLAMQLRRCYCATAEGLLCSYGGIIIVRTTKEPWALALLLASCEMR
ncbi:hypothetical protein DFH09DRAFT_1096533 [Mycena vulgaris]|nr:hypothetical protein DFH09DRAFT_1096533 [Mycena vulgaris]